jgi:hypothetical protein
MISILVTGLSGASCQYGQEHGVPVAGGGSPSGLYAGLPANGSWYYSYHHGRREMVYVGRWSCGVHYYVRRGHRPQRHQYCRAVTYDV